MLISSFGNKIGRLVEVDGWNLREEDCSTLKILLEVGIHDQILSKVSLLLNGEAFMVSMKE